jgi:hypothetical protein
MIEAKITPEERLLKIIEGTVSPSPALPARGGEISGGGLKFNLKALNDYLEKKIKNFHFDKNSLKNLDLGKANKIIAGVCVVFTVFWILNFAHEDFTSKERLEKIKIGAAVAGPIYKEENSLSRGANITELMAGATKRNIFTLSPQAKGAEVLPGQTPKGHPSAEAGIPGGIKLVGIIWTDNPQAMLEDAKEQKTYLVSLGDNIGDLKVKKIFADKIIMSKGAQEWELR